MDPNQVIAELLQAHGGLCALDRLHLPMRAPIRGQTAKFGLGCELYLPSIDRAVLREQAVQFLLNYQGVSRIESTSSFGKTLVAPSRSQMIQRHSFETTQARNLQMRDTVAPYLALSTSVCRKTTLLPIKHMS